MNEVISLAVRIAFALAAVGMLKPATWWLMKEVARHQRQGLISLVELNRAFQGMPKNSKQKSVAKAGGPQ